MLHIFVIHDAFLLSGWCMVNAPFIVKFAPRALMMGHFRQTPICDNR